MTDLSRQIVDAIIKGQDANAQKMFETAMSQSINRELDDMKVAVGQRIFTESVDTGYMPQKQSFSVEAIDTEGKPVKYNDNAYSARTVHKKAIDRGHQVVKVLDSEGHDVTDTAKTSSMYESKVEESIDQSFADWKANVASTYPKHANRIMHVAKPDGTISAQIPGKDRSFGVFDPKKGSGEVLTEAVDFNNPLINTAYDWHGGQSSPLYSFASTGGVVHSEDHRENLKHELDANITDAKTRETEGDSEYKGETSKLQALKDHISSVPVKHSLSESTSVNDDLPENSYDNFEHHLSNSSNPNATKEHLDAAIQHPHPYIRMKAAENPNATKEHIDKALTDTNSSVRIAAATNKNATKEHLDKALKDTNSSVRIAAATNPNASKSQIINAFNDKYSHPRYVAKGMNLAEDTATGDMAAQIADQKRQEKEAEDAEKAHQASTEKAPTLQDVVSILGNTVSVADTGVAK